MLRPPAFLCCLPRWGRACLVAASLGAAGWASALPASLSPAFLAEEIQAQPETPAKSYQLPVRRPPSRAQADTALAVADLPQQAQLVYAQILQGGPFTFQQDASIFFNREQRLPRQRRGYYREYTVAYNRLARTRGPRRIVCGGWQPSQPEACYYSADHYRSFVPISSPALRASRR